MRKILSLLKETLQEVFFLIPGHIYGSDTHEPQHEDNVKDESIERMRKK